MKQTKILLITVFSLFVLFTTVQAKKDHSEFYRMDLVVGDVKISQPGSDYWEDADADMLLQPNTQVKTGKDSYCDIILPKDAGLFRLIDNSVIQLVKTGAQIKKVRLNKGKIFVNIKPKKEYTSFEVETRVAVASVRGTRFLIQTDGDKVKTQVTRGKVVVRRNLSLPKIEGVNENFVAVETDSGEEIEMTLTENKQLENLLSRVKGNTSRYRKILKRVRTQDYKRKHLIRSLKEIMKDLYDTDNKLQNYGEDEKALDKHVDTIHKRRW